MNTVFCRGERAPQEDDRMTTFAIDDGNSNLIASGLDYRNVWDVAQREADKRGESVYVYEVRIGEDDDGTPTHTTEVAPKA